MFFNWYSYNELGDMMRIILLDNELEIHNITTLKEFNDKIFLLDIDNTPYEIKGNQLVLKEVYNNNSSIKITGSIYSIEKKNHKEAKDKKSFIKKLFA